MRKCQRARLKKQIPFHRYPAALFAVVIASPLLGCEAKPVKPTAAQIQALATKTRAQLIVVKGGEFQMGDFGEIHSSEKLPYTSEPNDGPLHNVTLSDFSIMKYKITLGDYDTYALANGLALPYQEPDIAVSDATISWRNRWQTSGRPFSSATRIG